MHRHRWRSRSSCRSPDINLQRLRKTASATRLCQPSSNLDMSARYRAWVGAHLLSAPLKTPKSLLNTALGESAHTPSGPMVVSKPRRCGSCRRPVGARECLFHAQAVAGTEQNATVDTPLRVLSVGFRFASIHDLSISQAAPQARMTLLSQSAGRERPTSVAKPGSASPNPAVRKVRSWRCGNHGPACLWPRGCGASDSFHKSTLRVRWRRPAGLIILPDKSCADTILQQRRHVAVTHSDHLARALG